MKPRLILAALLLAASFQPAAARIPLTAVNWSEATRNGQDDRQDYDAWFHHLRGAAYAGAIYGQTHRAAPGCGARPHAGQAWMDACLMAQKRLNEVDRLSRLMPDYHDGWMHPRVGG